MLYLNIRQKSRQFVDFLVKGLNKKGMFEPMCCIEVKSKGGG